MCHELNIPLLHMKSTFTFFLKISFLSTACKSMFVSNTQRQEHNNLVTNWRAYLKETQTQRVLQEPLVCKNLQPKCKPFEDFDHMTIMAET